MANSEDLRAIMSMEGRKGWRQYVVERRSRNSDWCADLRGANLSGTFLGHVDLRGADLRGVDFREANLYEADLSGADLRGAKFVTQERSSMGFGSFLDLASCIGIETATFDSPSVLPEYLEQAFLFALRSDTREAQEMGDWVSKQLDRIKALFTLQGHQTLSPSLIQGLDFLNAELIDYLKRHPKNLYDLTPRAFEKLIAEILAQSGWKVHLTARAKDGGYDIFAIEENPTLGTETSWLVECKRYARDRPVGVDVIRALYGSNIFMGRGAGAGMKMLATTSYFTKGVHEMKASTYDLALKDYQGILDWLNLYKPNPNGKLYLTGNQLVTPSSKE